MGGLAPQFSGSATEADTDAHVAPCGTDGVTSRGVLVVNHPPPPFLPQGHPSHALHSPPRVPSCSGWSARQSTHASFASMTFATRLCQVLISQTVLSEWLGECPGHGADPHISSSGGSSESSPGRAGTDQMRSGSAQLDVCSSVGTLLPPRFTAQLQASPASAPAVPRGMRRLRLFSLNDYLGLSTHPDVRRAAAEAARLHGMGACVQSQLIAACRAYLNPITLNPRAMMTGGSRTL